MKNPYEKNESIHKTYRNKFNRVKRVAKRKYYNKEFNEHKGKLRNRRAFCMRMHQYGLLKSCWRGTEVFSVNCLRSLLAFAGCFLELNDVYWVLRSTNVFFKVSRHFYDESEFIQGRCRPWEDSLSFLKTVHRRQDGGWILLRPNTSSTFFEQQVKVSMIIFRYTIIQ